MKSFERFLASCVAQISLLVVKNVLIYEIQWLLIWVWDFAIRRIHIANFASILYRVKVLCCFWNKIGGGLHIWFDITLTERKIFWRWVSHGRLVDNTVWISRVSIHIGGRKVAHSKEDILVLRTGETNICNQICSENTSKFHNPKREFKVSQKISMKDQLTEFQLKFSLTRLLQGNVLRIEEKVRSWV